MTYKERFDIALKSGVARQVDISIHRWETEGETVVGMVKAMTVRQSDTFDNDYHQYLIETDNGTIATIFGASVDMLFSTDSPVGKVFAFTYKGKRALDKGKTMNVFSVYEIPEQKGGK